MRPNILMVTADQWRGDCLGLLGHPVVQTPHLDAFASEASVFSRHFAPCAPCSPARASLYTGLYQMNHRVTHNGTPLDARFDNIALAARRAGYQPTLFGYTDTALDPRGRDPQDPELQGYEEVLPGFVCHQPLREDEIAWKAWLRARGHGGRLTENPHRVRPAPDGGVSLHPPGYGANETQTAFLADSFLDWHASQGQAPWFAHVSFVRPHPPFVVPEPFASMVQPDDVPMPIAVSDGLHILPRMMREMTPADHFQSGLTGTVAGFSENDTRRLRAIYFGMIAEVDAQLGRIFTALKDRDDWADTLVVFTSDHGEMLGDHGVFGKGGFYAESQHIPLMLRVPGRNAGRIDSFTSAVDIFPTLLEVLDIDPTHAPDGKSLLPVLSDPDMPSRSDVIWEFDFRHALTPVQMQALGLEPRACHLTVLRNDKAQYVHSPAFDPLLFDLVSDPDCLLPVAQRDGLWQDMAQALLTRITMLRDETLANLTLPLA